MRRLIPLALAAGLLAQGLAAVPALPPAVTSTSRAIVAVSA